MKFNRFICSDVHKSNTEVSIALEGGSEVRFFGEMSNTKHALKPERSFAGP